MSVKHIASALIALIGCILAIYTAIKKTGAGRKQALSGIGIFCVLMILSVQALAENKIQFFKYTDVYAGIDYSLYEDQSFCQGSGNDSRIVSNGAIKQNIVFFSSKKSQVSFDGKWQHGSCVFNMDSYVTDRLGFGVSYRRYWK